MKQVPHDYTINTWDEPTFQVIWTTKVSYMQQSYYEKVNLVHPKNHKHILGPLMENWEKSLGLNGWMEHIDETLHTLRIKAQKQ